MTHELRDHLLDWLRDAHAMEQQAEQMLRMQASRIEHYPQVKARIEQHIDETCQQQHLVARCIERLGGSPSAVKDLAGKAMAFGQAVAGMASADEIVKGLMASYVFEHMEIASYTALIAAADAAGDAETRGTCESILVQEKVMAQWLHEHLPGVVGDFLARDATPSTEAKR
ncbi:ferritin-like domain-containing protein [Fulvimonas sp. R45]|uniref:ferritin-like domain-containing protein n=1 Tax=Fulvimonas sp. R45 TaxID=3045937 RepID=UPI00265EE451|nr:ferritin-like domain-containing protein [Fulvimonas sp. R45]MDO1527259.1 ferritin-like domain-containing protein [Fulvimonas sp. R45]